ncbi:MAG: DsbA family protein, partial [Nitrospirales bacterium]
EPASRAVVAVRKLQADQVFSFFQDVQRAFYVENLNVTKVEVLADLATSRGIDREQFLTSFQSAELRKEVLEEFDSCRKLDINGFPSLLAQNGQQVTPLAHGYQPIEALTPLIDAWLEKASVL